MPPELRLLGGVSVLVDGKPITGAATQPRRIAVLAVLAEAAPAPVTRERLVGLIWPEQDETSARRLLTQAIYELRRELGDVIVVGSGRDLTLDTSALDVDLVQFRRVIAEDNAPRAAALHRGPFLDGFYLRDAGEFERWAASVREIAGRDLRRVIESAIGRHESAGEIREAAGWAERLVQLTPHDAPAVVRAISLLERAGDPGAAARVASAYEQRMRVDLELAPDESVTRRAARIGAVTPRVAYETPANVPAIPADAHTRSRSDAGPLRSARGWRMLGATVAAALLVGVVMLYRRDGDASANGHAVVVVNEFDTHGDAEAARAAARLAPLLVADLSNVGGVQFQQGTTRDGGRALTGAASVSGRTVRVDVTLSPRETGRQEFHSSVAGSVDSLDALAARLALELAPEFYPNLDAASRREVVRGLTSVAAARAYLDGESALKRAAFDSAYAALRAATLADSGNAFLWYRRAVAAEEMQHIDDADRSAAIADEARQSLRPRDRDLVHAYRVWRTGDVRAADSLYRAILRTRPGDAEAWFHFAEVAYHGGPLIGRPLDDARDAWRRAVSLDSNSFPALMHAVRLEARARNEPAIRALLDRATRVQAREPYLSEARAIAAAAMARTSTDADLPLLGRMPDASLQFVHAIVAAFVERPELALIPAKRLVEATRPDAVRSEGYAALANLAMSRGQTQLANAMLDSLGKRSVVRESWSRAYFATLPFLPRDSARVAQAARQLSAAPLRSTDAPLYLDLSVDASVSELIRRYSAALLSSESRGGLECAHLTSDVTHDLCLDLERGISAEMLVRRGDPVAALRTLEAMSMRVPYQLGGRSVYFARTRERFLRAQLLERAGRLDEAYDWYAAVPYAARLDYVYLVPSHLGRARLRERQGDRVAASEHYRRAVELLSSSDATAAVLRREAEDGLRRTGGS